MILLCPLSLPEGVALRAANENILIASGNHTIIHGDVNVVTYEELFQLLLVLISFAGLIITIIKKK